MSVEVSPAAVLLAGFRAWLAGERGLSRETVRCYGNQAGTFLAWLPDPVDAAVRQLDSGQVTAFMVDYCGGRNTWSAKAMATALRALLRFLHVSGQTSRPLAGAVPGVAGWRLASLPRGLDAAVVTRLLDSCDRTTVVGRRDYAILLVLARLGLRGGEVAALRCWLTSTGALARWWCEARRARVERLPLPREVGAALAGYLTEARPRCACPGRFVRHGAGALPGADGGSARRIMGRAWGRAGRSAATRRAPAAPHPGDRVLRAGAPLADVGQVLRHRSQLSTAIYAKVDHTALRTLAQPWRREGGRDDHHPRQHAEAYLAMRRRLGFKLTTFGQKLAEVFVGYPTRAAGIWPCSPPPRRSPGGPWIPRRTAPTPCIGAGGLMVVRIFARHLHGPGTGNRGPTRRHPAAPLSPDSPAFVSPPPRWPPCSGAAEQLQPPFRARTVRTTIGLLAVTGLRTSEACGLDAHRRRPRRRGVTCGTQSSASRARCRCTPAPSRRCGPIRRLRPPGTPRPRTPCVLAVHPRDATRRPQSPQYLRRPGARRRRLQVVGPRRPRLHDLRHTFATATLLHWYRDGADVQARLPLLTTYLGHADPKSTYWYLSGAPELLALAAARVEPSAVSR